MSFTNLNNVVTIRSFEEAEYYFGITEKPRSWSTEDRSLKDTRSAHYALRRRDADTYAVCLYGTEVIRYHRPVEDGSYGVDVLTTHHIATKQWLQKHMGIPADIFQVIDTEGDARLVGLLSNKHIRLTFNASRRLDTSNSTTGLLSRAVTSPERKEQRKDLSKALEPYMMMAYYASMSRSLGDWGQRYEETAATRALAHALKHQTVAEVCPELWGQIMSPVGDMNPKKAIGDFKMRLVNLVFPLRDSFEYYPPFPLKSDIAGGLNTLCVSRGAP